MTSIANDQTWVRKKGDKIQHLGDGSGNADNTITASVAVLYKDKVEQSQNLWGK